MTSVSEPYLDQAGQPRLRESIVAFFDILGFSESSAADVSIAESQRTLDKIATAIKDSRQFVRSALPGGQPGDSMSWATKFFSDNLAFGYPLDDAVADPGLITWLVVRCAQRYQLRMALSGFFLRGALTEGAICLTDEVIFGPALIECYRLESKASIVPRVLIAEPLFRQIASFLNASPFHFSNDQSDLICRDVDGWWFVNYLQAARRPQGGIDWDVIEQHKQSVLDSLSHTTRHEVLPKFGWACRYHNVFCYWHRDEPGYSDACRIDRADEQSTIVRLSDSFVVAT